MLDPGGATGPVDPDPARWAAWRTGGLINAVAPFEGVGNVANQQTTFRINDGGYCYVTESTVTTIIFTGARGVRNTSLRCTWDAMFVGNARLTVGGITRHSCDDTWVSNFDVFIGSGYPIAQTDRLYLTIAGAVFNGTNTILTMAEDPDLTSVRIGTIAALSTPNCITARQLTVEVYGSAVKWLTGSNVGRSSGGLAYGSASVPEGNFYGGAHMRMQYPYTPVGSALSTIGVTFACANITSGAPMGHGLEAGMPVIFTTTGVLPGGLQAGATYFVSATGRTTSQFQVAANQSDALAGINSLNVSSPGTGTLGFESRCILVNDDFSTATGGTRVGDLVRPYSLAHGDVLQIGQAGGSDFPNVQNLTLQGYRAQGPGISNMMILQQSWPGATLRDSAGNFTNAISVTAAAGSTDFTVPAGTTLWPNDFLRVADVGHPAYGESMRVLSYDKVSGSGTLAIPFSVTLAGDKCIQCKSAYGLSFQNMIVANTSGLNGLTAQWQAAVANFTVRQCTIVSQKDAMPAAPTSEFWLRNKKGSNPALMPFGCEAFLIIDSIVESISAEDVWPAQARAVNVRRRRRATSGSNAPLDNASLIGMVAFDENWRPVYGIETPQIIKGPASLPWGFTPPSGSELKRGAFGNIGAVP